MINALIAKSFNFCQLRINLIDKLSVLQRLMLDQAATAYMVKGAPAPKPPPTVLTA